MHLARREVVPEEHAGEDGHKVLLVVDVRDGRDGRVGVHVVGEGLVADAREAEADVGDLRGGEVEREVHGIQKGDRRTCEIEGRPSRTVHRTLPWTVAKRDAPRECPTTVTFLVGY